MARLAILEYPDPRLRTRADRVTKVDDEIRRLVDDMFETMYAAPGIGLAAVQVNVPKRVIVIDVSAEGNQPHCFINPEIVASSGRTSSEEGCLSVPGYYDVVERAERVTVRALDRDGQPFELEAEGLLAICIQHEIDHLDGKLFVDHLSELKRERLRKKLTKKAKRAAAEATEAPIRRSAPVI
ncbi:MAG TPA: peptide deformylase [Gammaproteobacteria bacterium]